MRNHFPKEFRIGQTCRQNLLITRKNGCALIRGFAVRNGDKAGDFADFVSRTEKNF